MLQRDRTFEELHVWGVLEEDVESSELVCACDVHHELHGWEFVIERPRYTVTLTASFLSTHRSKIPKPPLVRFTLWLCFGEEKTVIEEVQWDVDVSHFTRGTPLKHVLTESLEVYQRYDRARKVDAAECPEHVMSWAALLHQLYDRAKYSADLKMADLVMQAHYYHELRLAELGIVMCGGFVEAPTSSRELTWYGEVMPTKLARGVTTVYTMMSLPSNPFYVGVLS